MTKEEIQIELTELSLGENALHGIVHFNVPKAMWLVNPKTCKLGNCLVVKKKHYVQTANDFLIYDSEHSKCLKGFYEQVLTRRGTICKDHKVRFTGKKFVAFNSLITTSTCCVRKAIEFFNLEEEIIK